MKLTETRIKQIILEELSALSEEEQGEQEEAPAAPEPEEKVDSSVEIIDKLLPKINNYIKYEQLVKKVLGHEFNDEQGKARVLKALRATLNKSS